MRKAQQAGVVASAELNEEILDGLRGEWRAALRGVEAEVQGLEARKADAQRVDAQLDGKADAALLRHMADRSFCEALLAKFSVEVGRELEKIEEEQQRFIATMMSSTARTASAGTSPTPSPRVKSSAAPQGSRS